MSKRRTIFALAACAAVVTAAGCGGSDHGAGHDGGAAGPPGSSAAGPPRIVEVEMRDIAFEPATVEVKAGETVKFVFRNVGQLPHDAFIGDESAQAEHEQEMVHGAEGGGHHDAGHHADGRAVTVPPGETASLTYTFEDAGPLLIGCHQPGHYTAGMKLTVAVV